jgi:lycopene cyclase domain-containing protein
MPRLDLTAGSGPHPPTLTTIDRWQYLIVLGLCVLVTLPLELGPPRLGLGVRVWRQPRRLVLSIAPVWAVFVAWDIWATLEGTWSFADRYTIGVRLPGDLALEELAFFVVVPICGLLTLETVRRMSARFARCERASAVTPEAAG